MHVSSLHIYPVKSLRGCAVDTAAVDALGIVNDRRFLVVDETGRFLTQRVLPKMVLIITALSTTHLTLAADGAGSISVPLRTPADQVAVRTVTIWKSEGLQADDCGDEVATWLSTFLGLTCRLVRIGDAFRRPMLKATARPGDIVAFTDAYPFMLVSDASLDDLNQRLIQQGDEPMPMNRFRPTFTIADAAPYAEDTWTRIRIGDVILRAGGPCVRCIVTTTDQLTGERGKEPLRLLASYRRNAAEPTAVNFGQNYIHETKAGRLSVGDPVELFDAGTCG